MKLRNKKTGEIKEFALFDGIGLQSGATLESLTKEWEDYHEEPEVGFIIDPMEEDYISADDSGYTGSDVERAKELGIWFEAEEEAERVVEKLKAWKRLKDKGFRFLNNKTIGEYGNVTYTLTYPATNVEEKDLELLFGEEKE